MIAPDRLALFAAAALVLLLVPGPAVLYVVTRSIHQGRRAGLVSVLGIHLGTLVSRKADSDVALGGERRLPRVFTQGVVVNVLNPKTALFFLAFLPQFVDPHHGHAALQIALLGLTFAALGLVTDSIWAIAAGTAGDGLRRSRRFARVQRYVSGSVFVGLGVVTALAGAHHTSD